jgi:hypothetical protein
MFLQFFRNSLKMGMKMLYMKFGLETPYEYITLAPQI